MPFSDQAWILHFGKKSVDISVDISACHVFFVDLVFLWTFVDFLTRSRGFFTPAKRQHYSFN